MAEKSLFLINVADRQKNICNNRAASLLKICPIGVLKPEVLYDDRLVINSIKTKFAILLLFLKFLFSFQLFLRIIHFIFLHVYLLADLDRFLFLVVNHLKNIFFSIITVQNIKTKT